MSGSFDGGTMKTLVCMNCPDGTIVQSMSIDKGGMKMAMDEVMTAVTIKKKAAAPATK